MPVRGFAGAMVSRHHHRIITSSACARQSVRPRSAPGGNDLLISGKVEASRSNRMFWPEHLLAISGQNVALVTAGVLGVAWLLGLSRAIAEVGAVAAIGT